MTSYIKATLSVWHSYGAFTVSGQIGEGVFDSKKQAASLDNEAHYNGMISCCWKHLPMTNTHTGFCTSTHVRILLHRITPSVSP